MVNGNLVYAQTDFRAGYVLNYDGDTLFGEIDYRGDYLMSQLCRFRKSGADSAIRFTPDDISGYRFENSKYFVSKEIDGKKIFVEYLIKGKVNVYFSKTGEFAQYCAEKDNSGLTAMPYEEEIRSFGDKRYFYESKKHVGILGYFMQDAPSLRGRINKMKKPEHKNLVKLAEDYHNIVCKDEKCVIYEKKVPFSGFTLRV